VRGLVPANYDPDLFMILHAGISSWIGSKRGVQTGNASAPEDRFVASEYLVLNFRHEQPLISESSACNRS